MVVNELHNVYLNEESAVAAVMAGCLEVVGVQLPLSPSPPHLPVLIATNLHRLCVVLITVEELLR